MGFSFLKERFSTRVRRDARRSARSTSACCAARSASSPTAGGSCADEAGTRIEFDIDFEFKSRLLEGLLAANFHHAVERLMACFEDRAKALLRASRYAEEAEAASSAAQGGSPVRPAPGAREGPP